MTVYSDSKTMGVTKVFHTVVANGPVDRDMIRVFYPDTVSVYSVRCGFGKIATTWAVPI